MINKFLDKNIHDLSKLLETSGRILGNNLRKLNGYNLSSYEYYLQKFLSKNIKRINRM